MRSSRLDFDQLAQPTPVPTPNSSLSSALLEPIATAVPGQPTKVSTQAMTPMIKKARKPRARTPKEVMELENLGYPQVERLQKFSNSDVRALNDEIKNEVAILRQEIAGRESKLIKTPAD